MAKKKMRSKNFGDVIRAKLAANPELARAVEDESFNAQIAQQVYELREEAKLTQKQLAELIGTQQSVISRIEDADYDSHSLSILKRIAVALNRQLKIDFCARPVHHPAVITEFPLDWSTSEKWNAAMSNTNCPRILDPNVIAEAIAVIAPPGSRRETKTALVRI